MLLLRFCSSAVAGIRDAPIAGRLSAIYEPLSPPLTAWPSLSMPLRSAVLLTLSLAAVESFRLLAPPRAPARPGRHGPPLAQAPAVADLPMEPVAGLGPREVCSVVCTGLQHNDSPAQDAGIERLFHWMTGPGRVSVAPPPPKAGLQGGVTLEYFMAEAAAPAIGALMECATTRARPAPPAMAWTQRPGARAAAARASSSWARPRSRRARRPAAGWRHR